MGDVLSLTLLVDLACLVWEVHDRVKLLLEQLPAEPRTGQLPQVGHTLAASVEVENPFLQVGTRYNQRRRKLACVLCQPMAPCRTL